MKMVTLYVCVIVGLIGIVLLSVKMSDDNAGSESHVTSEKSQPVRKIENIPHVETVNTGRSKEY